MREVVFSQPLSCVLENEPIKLNFPPFGCVKARGLSYHKGGQY